MTGHGGFCLQKFMYKWQYLQQYKRIIYKRCEKFTLEKISKTPCQGRFSMLSGRHQALNDGMYIGFASVVSSKNKKASD
jgi:hypothetical protein